MLGSINHKSHFKKKKKKKNGEENKRTFVAPFARFSNSSAHISALFHVRVFKRRKKA